MAVDRRKFLRSAATTGIAALVVRPLRAASPEDDMPDIFTAAEADRQLPRDDEIFLDHVGHFVRDPQAASAALTRAGFAPTPISIQVNPGAEGDAPRLTGTGNVTAMLRRGYLEMLFKTADTPLGRELDAALARYPGLHLAAFSVADAAKAHRRLTGAGFGTRPLVQMERPVETETGTGKAAFTVARVVPEAMAEGRIQILTHRTEETVWQRRWLTHPNGALGLLDVVIAESDMAEAARRFQRFTDRKAIQTGAGMAVPLDRGRVQLMTSDSFGALLPDVAVPGLPFIGAYGVAVRSRDTTEKMLRQGGITSRRHGSVNAGWNLTRFARGRRLESDPPSLLPGWGAPHPGRRAVQDFSFGLARMPARRLSFSR